MQKDKITVVELNSTNAFNTKWVTARQSVTAKAIVWAACMVYEVICHLPWKSASVYRRNLQDFARTVSMASRSPSADPQQGHGTFPDVSLGLGFGRLCPCHLGAPADVHTTDRPQPPSPSTSAAGTVALL